VLPRSAALLLFLSAACGARSDIDGASSSTAGATRDSAPSDDGALAPSSPDAASAGKDASAPDAPTRVADSSVTDGDAESSDATTDATSPDATISDASDATVSEGSDATLSDGSDADVADADVPDTIDSNPLAKCQTAPTRDILYQNFAAAAPYGASTVLLTNLDSNWFVENSDLLRASVNRASIYVSLQDGGPLVPGAYTVGDTGQVAFTLGEGSQFLSGVGGMVDVLEADMGGPSGLPGLTHVLLSYSATVDTGITTQPVEGCVRYTASLPYVPSDAGVVALPDGGDAGAELLAPCAGGGDVFYVDSEGMFPFPNVAGPKIITSALGTWAASTSPDAGVFVGVTDITEWSLSVSHLGAAPGTYVVAGAADLSSYLMLQEDGYECPVYPVGTYTLAAFESPDGSAVTKVLMSFDLTCGSDSTMRGCVSYEQ
jgi:hypothetical protein